MSRMSLPDTFVEGFHDESAVRRMTYTEFGKTGLRVSKLSLGGGTLSHFYGELDVDNAIQAIQQAIRSGINYIDTAYWYGQGRSEEILGLALKDVPRQAYYLATKVARYELDYPRMFDFSAAAAKKSFERSLKLLQLDYVDILQIHDLEFAPDKAVILNELLPALEELKASGKVKFIGVTGYPIHELQQCVEGAANRFDMVLSYARNTLCDDSLHQYLPFFKSQGLGLICASPVAMGLLSNGGPQAWHPASKELKDLCRQAAEICKAKNIELAKLALYHTLATVGPEGPHSILVGMQTVEILKMNLSVVFDGLSEDELKLYDYLNAEFFSKILQRAKLKHWENFEVRRYWAEIENEKRGKAT